MPYQMKQSKLERAEKWRHNKYVNIWRLTFKTPIPHGAVNIAHQINKNQKNMAVIQPRPTHILNMSAKCGDDRTPINVICDVCDV